MMNDRNRLFLLSAVVAIGLSSWGRSAAQPVAAFRVAPFDTSGNPIVSIGPGEPFVLNFYAQDLRVPAQGVFSAYVDLSYDDSNFASMGKFTFNDVYPFARTGFFTMPGFVDEVGAIFAETSPVLPASGERLVVSLPMQSRSQSGVGSFDVTSADLAESQITVFGRNSFVPPNEIRFVGSRLAIKNGRTADFSGDGKLDCDDITQLMQRIGAATDVRFDLTGDGTVDVQDRDAWLSDAGQFHLGEGRRFLAGDVTFDGAVDSSDLGVLLNRFGQVGPHGWCDGNLNGDAFVNSLDLGRLLNDFKRTSVSAVPEPLGFTQALVFLVAALYLLRRR